MDTAVIDSEVHGFYLRLKSICLLHIDAGLGKNGGIGDIVLLLEDQTVAGALGLSYASNLHKTAFELNYVFRAEDEFRLEYSPYMVVGKKLSAGFGKLPWGTRGDRKEISNFSWSSRNCLQKRLLAVDWLNVELRRLRFVTLTYPDIFPDDGRVAANHLRLFLKRYRYRYQEYDPVLIWKKELQKRGAIHFHIFVVFNKDKDIDKKEIDFVKGVWYDVAHDGDKNKGVAGTQVDYIKSKTGACCYFANYMGLEKGKDKAYQNNIPKSIKNFGRFWGIVNREGFDKISDLKIKKVDEKKYKDMKRIFNRVNDKWKKEKVKELEFKIMGEVDKIEAENKGFVFVIDDRVYRSPMTEKHNDLFRVWKRMVEKVNDSENFTLFDYNRDIVLKYMTERNDCVPCYMGERSKEFRRQNMEFRRGVIKEDQSIHYRKLFYAGIKLPGRVYQERVL